MAGAAAGQSAGALPEIPSEAHVLSALAAWLSEMASISMSADEAP